MEKKVQLSIDAIYKEKFEKDVKGYNPDQVDSFLDKVISDYDAFESIISSKDAQIEGYRRELEELKKLMDASSGDRERLRQLERDNSVMREKLDSIKPGDAPNAENMKYLQLINRYETFLHDEGYDPKTLRKRSV